MRRNRDFGNNNAMTGPLMTSHLRDLDMELELLKRKREIIQQEQNMLSRISRQNNYEQPSNSYNRHEHGHYEPPQVNVSNFANLYDVPGGSRSFRQQGFKRPPQTHWQAPNPPKRFNAPRAMNPWQNDNMNEQAQSRKPFQPPKPRFSQLVPLMSLKPGIGQRIKKDNRQQPRRDFQPNKVTKPNVQPAKSMKSKDFQPKPKTQPGPAMKLATCPPVEAKKLVSETMKAIKPQVDDQILYADRQPSLQMKGRMELALGSLLKEMRQEYCTDPDASEYFVTQYIQRIIKQTIRLRIRDVMMGKVIGAVSDILENYRKIHPKETDLEILNVVKDAQAYSSKNLSVTHLIESDDPLDFFRKNMQRVISSKLEKLFSNLQTFYENKDVQIIDSINKLPEPDTLELNKIDEPKDEEKKTPSNDKSNLFQIINNFFDSVPGNNEFVKALGGRLDKAKHYIDFMDKLLEERLPKVLPKFRDVIINILYSDKEFFGTKAMIMTEMKKKVKDFVIDDALEQKKVEPARKDRIEVSGEKIEEGNKPAEPTKLDLAAVDNTPTVLAPVDKTATVPAPTDNTPTVAAPTEKTPTVAAPTEKTPTVAAPTDNTPTVAAPTEKTPTVAAPTEKTPTVAAPTDNTPTVAAPTKKTPTVAAPTEKTPTVAAPTKKTPTVAATGDKTPTVAATGDKTQLYYVKLLGRPKLPARAVIYEFLNQFNPKSIKKHKSINNLLVIAFDNKEDLKKILDANESVIGDSTIIIKASEQITANKETPVENNTEPENLDKISNSSKLNENITCTDLDHQITDLLSAIRKSDEKDTEDTNGVDMTEKNVPESNDEVEFVPDKVDKVTDKVEEVTDKVSEVADKVDEQTANKEVIEIKDNVSTQDEQSTKNDEEIQKNVEDIKDDSEGNKMDTQDDEANVEIVSESIETEGDKLQKLEDLKSNIKESGMSTPTRTSSRLPSTPSTVRTRRANRLAQNYTQ